MRLPVCRMPVCRNPDVDVLMIARLWELSLQSTARPAPRIGNARRGRSVGYLRFNSWSPFPGSSPFLSLVGCVSLPRCSLFGGGPAAGLGTCARATAAGAAGALGIGTGLADAIGSARARCCSGRARAFGADTSGRAVAWALLRGSGGACADAGAFAWGGRATGGGARTGACAFAWGVGATAGGAAPGAFGGVRATVLVRCSGSACTGAGAFAGGGRATFTGAATGAGAFGRLRPSALPSGSADACGTPRCGDANSRCVGCAGRDVCVPACSCVPRVIACGGVRCSSLPRGFAFAA